MHRQIKARDNGSSAIRQKPSTRSLTLERLITFPGQPTRELTTCQHHAIHYPAETVRARKLRMALSAMVLAVFI